MSTKKAFIPELNSENPENESFENWDNLEDEEKDKANHDGLIEELSDEFNSGDADEVLERLESLGYDIDDLEL